MAAGKSQKGLSASIIAGSEEIFDFYCQPCSTENRNVEAVKYCQNCCEYLCDNCSKAHLKFAVSKHHIILDKSAMPKSKVRHKCRDILTETCPKHREKVLEYFCNDHSQICCSVCLTLNHISCSDKSYIPEVSDVITNSQEYKRLKLDLERLISLMTDKEKMLETYNKDNDKLHTAALANIKDFRKQINTVLDKLEEDAERRITALHAENTGKIKTASGTVKTLQTEVTTLKSDLWQKENEGKNNQLFVLAKLSQGRVDVIDSTVKELNVNKFSRFTFHHDEKIQQMVSTLSAIWSQSIRQDDTPTKARYVREVNVKSKDDTEDCNISGISVLDEDRMVVTDIDNKAVKLINMKVKQLVSRLSLSSKPHDLTEIKPNKVAVVLGSIKKIEIIAVSDVLSRSQTISTPGASIVGLCFDGSNFITACRLSVSVKIIDMSGRTLNTFDTDSHGKQLFTKPRWIAICRDKNVVYVTDRNANTVTTMTTSGNVISVYRHDKLQRPAAVAVGREGAVYVCSAHTCTVHQLCPTSDRTRILLEQDQGLASFPHAIAYGDNEDRLYVSSGSSVPEKRNYIRLYQLE